jgi:hypothetical protein
MNCIVLCEPRLPGLGAFALFEGNIRGIISRKEAIKLITLLNPVGE